MENFSRRLVMGFAAALPLVAVGRRAWADEPEILAAPADSSLLLARAVASGVSPGASFRVWRSPDDLRAGVVSGRAAIFSAPLNVAANLRAKGAAVRLVAAVSVGPMSVLTVEPGVAGPGDLKGQRIQLYFRGDMPDILMRLVVGRAGLDPESDLAIDYAGSAPEAAQLFLAGRATTILLNEPTATATLAAAIAAGRPARRAFVLQKAWAETDGHPLPPLAGVMVTEEAERASPGLSVRLARGLREAADWVRADPAGAGDLAERTLGFKAPAIVAALGVADVRVSGARTARADVERLLSEVAGRSPALIGGRLPDDGFYADVE